MGLAEVGYIATYNVIRANHNHIMDVLKAKDGKNIQSTFPPPFSLTSNLMQSYCLVVRISPQPHSLKDWIEPFPEALDRFVAGCDYVIFNQLVLETRGGGGCQASTLLHCWTSRGRKLNCIDEINPYL